jgi:hypothetical protein
LGVCEGEVEEMVDGDRVGINYILTTRSTPLR